MHNLYTSNIISANKDGSASEASLPNLNSRLGKIINHASLMSTSHLEKKRTVSQKEARETSRMNNSRMMAKNHF
jgi:hypothetical protein